MSGGPSSAVVVEEAEEEVEEVEERWVMEFNTSCSACLAWPTQWL